MSKIAGYLACNPLVSQFDANQHRVQMIVHVVDDTIVKEPVAVWLESYDAETFKTMAKGDTVVAEIGKIVSWDGQSVFTAKDGSQLQLCKVRGFNGQIRAIEQAHKFEAATDEQTIRRGAGLLARQGAVQKAADLLAGLFGKKPAAAKADL